jgi:hypothetical protein
MAVGSFAKDFASGRVQGRKERKSAVAKVFEFVTFGPPRTAMIFDGVDTDVFQYYLDHLAKGIPPLDSKRRLLIVDNASWHKAQRLNFFCNLRVVFCIRHRLYHTLQPASGALI